MRGKGQSYRFWACPVLLCGWFILLAVRASCLHLGQQTPSNKIGWKRPLPAARGFIYDRASRPIAITDPGRRVFLDYSSVDEKHDLVQIASAVAEQTGRDTDAVLLDFRSRRSKYIVQGITYDDRVMALVTNRTRYSGVGLERVLRRQYPLGRCMSHVVGFVNKQQVGSAGIEQQYNRFLQGTDGMIEGTRDGEGKEIRARRASTAEPIDGAHVYLTLDQNIQQVAEKALAEGLAASHGTGARVIVQLVKTGEILAMAAAPDYDPAHYQAVPDLRWQNPNIGQIYDPGSTMKSIIVAAALNDGLITPDSTFDVGHGSWYYGGHTLHDKVYGTADVRTIIRKSSNIGAAMIGLMLGNRRMECYLRAFGFGAALGIDLPGEERGLLPPAAKWEMVKPTRIAIGQGISVTPLQMLNAYCTIANGGKLMRPYVVSKVVAPGGEVMHENVPRVIGRPIRPEVAAQMRDMLFAVTEDGTGKRAVVAGYPIAGKTGTAQMIIPGVGYSDTDYWASFVGFVPVEQPEFGMIVIIDSPRGVRTGGAVAAPVFAKIASVVAQYLELPIAEPPEAGRAESSELETVLH